MIIFSSSYAVNKFSLLKYFQEVVKLISIKVTESSYIDTTLHVGQNRLLSSIFEVMEIYSEVGRCYSVYSDNILNINATLKFVLNINR